MRALHARVVPAERFATRNSLGERKTPIRDLAIVKGRAAHQPAWLHVFAWSEQGGQASFAAITVIAIKKAVMYASSIVPGTNCTVGVIIPYSYHHGVAVMNIPGTAVSNPAAGPSASPGFDRVTQESAARDARSDDMRRQSNQTALEQCFSLAGLNLPSTAAQNTGNRPFTGFAPTTGTQPAMWSPRDIESGNGTRAQHVSSGGSANRSCAGTTACAAIAGITLAALGIAGYFSFLAMFG